jgi:rubrerythrin
MDGNNAVDLLKGAILLERRGRALYEGAARQASAEPVRLLFETLAQEESRHQAWLESLFVQSAVEGAATGFRIPSDTASHPVIDSAMAAAIASAGFESAVVSAAVGLEQAAIAYYEEAAARSRGEAADLFTKLADWERTHLELLTSLDRQIRERAWFESGFWPSI